MSATIRRLLFVSPVEPGRQEGGRSMLANLNGAILSDLLGDRLVRFTLKRDRLPSPMEMVRGHLDGADRSAFRAIDALIGAQEIDHLFLDGSNLGGVARHVRRHHPGCRITTFLHNVETRFFWGAWRSRPSLRALAVLAAHYRAERAAVRSSHRLICLSERDSHLLRRIHGRGADAIAPLAVLEQACPPSRPADAASPYALFVGGGFYGNLDGIRWFADAVAPRSPIPILVVGRGMDALAAELAGHPTMRLIGAVDHLAPWYEGAQVAIAPILDGSGMKTKVAEALMFGKRVIGSAEAFAGYAEDVIAAGWLCRDADSFVAALKEVAASRGPVFDPHLRSLYEHRHSVAAARSRMADILGTSPDSCL